MTVLFPWGAPTNAGEPWGDGEVDDLKNCAACGVSLRETADLVCRTEAETLAKAIDLGLQFPRST